MNAKVFLGRIQKIDKEIDSLLEEMEGLDDILIKASQIDPMKVSGGKSSSPEDFIVRRITKKEEREKELNKKIDEYVDLKIKAGRMIDEMDDPTERAILKHRYLSYGRWEEIAEKLNYTTRHVQRIHGQALKEFEKILKKP